MQTWFYYIKKKNRYPTWFFIRSNGLGGIRQSRVNSGTGFHTI